MKNVIELKAGDRIEIVSEEKRTVSMIESITKKGNPLISVPMMGTTRVPLEAGEGVEVLVIRPNSILKFAAVVTRFVTEGMLNLTELGELSEIIRLQRREYVRFDTLLPVTITPLDEESQKEELDDTEAVSRVINRRISGEYDEDAIIAACTLDISGGGMRFYCKKMLEIDTIADCEIFLSDGSKANAVMRVVRCERDYHEGNAIMGARFIGMAESLREGIIKYIFAEQLKRRQKSRKPGM